MAAANKDEGAEALTPEEAFTEEFIEEEVWAYEPAGPSTWAKVGAEATGTFLLVLMGVGAALLSPFGNNGSLTVGLSFGVAVIIGAIVFGAVSGGHFNPAVTVGAWLAGRIPSRDVAPYILAQLLGAAAAGGALVVFVNGNPGLAAAISTDGGSQGVMRGVSNGFGEHSPSFFPGYGVGGFSLGVALMVEAIATAALVAVILSATSRRAPKGVAPFAIGLSLAILVVWAIPFTNAALNPARAFGTALFGQDWALSQLWVFVVGPVLGAAIVGLLFRAFAPEDDLEILELLEEIED